MKFPFAALFIAVLGYARISIGNKVIMHEFTSSMCLPLPINSCKKSPLFLRQVYACAR
jgi:hypothetical protein